ncbi:Os09g0320400, partial [Oryza sativa Japonica Group]
FICYSFSDIGSPLFLEYLTFSCKSVHCTCLHWKPEFELCCSCVQFNDYINSVFSSPPTVALIMAVLLDNTLDVREAARDRGMPWWARFRTFRGDSRNEEFYTLPFNLNRFFPPS